jgi:hypothetical protein
MSELYRQSDRRLSAKLVPTFAVRGVSYTARRIPYGRNLDFLDRLVRYGPLFSTTAVLMEISVFRDIT